MIIDCFTSNFYLQTKIIWINTAPNFKQQKLIMRKSLWNKSIVLLSWVLFTKRITNVFRYLFLFTVMLFLKTKTKTSNKKNIRVVKTLPYIKLLWIIINKLTNCCWYCYCYWSCCFGKSLNIKMKNNFLSIMVISEGKNNAQKKTINKNKRKMKWKKNGLLFWTKEIISTSHRLQQHFNRRNLSILFENYIKKNNRLYIYFDGKSLNLEILK